MVLAGVFSPLQEYDRYAGFVTLGRNRAWIGEVGVSNTVRIPGEGLRSGCYEREGAPAWVVMNQDCG